MRQPTSTRRSPWIRSPRRPARGPVSKRTAVPALSTSPSWAAGTPRALTKAGRKGDATPKAAYIAAYRRRKRGSAVDRTVSPKGAVLMVFSLAACVCLVCHAPACFAHETARVFASPSRRPSLATQASWQTASLLIEQGAQTEVAEPHGVAVMLERDMAAGRSAKAGKRLKLALGHQRCQGGALQRICHDQHPIKPLFYRAGPGSPTTRV